MNTELAQKLDRYFNKATASNLIREAVLFVQNGNGDFSYNKGYGGLNIDSPLLLASVTKLFTAACVLTMREQGMLTLDDKISKYLDNSIINGLHIYKGHEYSFDLTIADLLFQISGLPDVYEEGKNCLKAHAVKEDFSYSFSDIAEMTRKLVPHFEPGSANKAYYADINFDMLGEIIKKITNWPLSNVYRHYIYEPLGLVNTYLPESENDIVPYINYKHNAIHRPKFVMSCRASGGCVSTARELMTFLKAFFGGRLFNITFFDELSACYKLQASMGPICYGSGYMRIPLNGWATLFMGSGELKGHSGSTGSFAFYYPLKDLFITGNLNQMANSALPVRLSMRIVL